MRSRRVSRREVVAVVVSGIVIAVVMTWPLASQMNEILPGMGRIGDPYLHTWQIAWEAHALETDPGNYFQANTHWPHEDSLAFIDTTTGYAPAGLIGDGVEAAVVRYNVLYLFAYSLAFIGAYLLARQLGVGVGGAFVAAAAFSFAPWRAAQNGHLIVLSSGGIPLALFFLLRGYMHRSVRAVVAGAAVVLWQLSVGFTLGLQFVYLLGGLAAMFAFRLWKKREPDVSRRFLVAVGASTAAVLVGGLLLAIPFLRVAERYPEATDRVSELRLYSPPPSSFLVAPRYNVVWGDEATDLRRRLRWPEEQTLFPGLAIVGLASVGAVWGPLNRKVRLFLVFVAVGVGILSMGVAWGPSRVLYSILYDLAPGWRGIRTPGRLNTTTSLALALLAGGGAAVAIRGAAERWKDWSRTGAMVAAALMLLVLLEGKGSIWSAPPRGVPEGLTEAEAPMLHLPFDEIHDRIYTFWSIEGFPDTVNGVGAIVPEELSDLRERMKDFPDATTVDELRALGVRTVVLHPVLALDTPWENVVTASVDDLGVGRAEVGDVILFDLDPE